MNFKGRSNTDFLEDFQLSPLDSELHALHKLSKDTKAPTFDDRQFVIELQTEQKLSLNDNSLMAVVCPSVYLDDEDFRKFFEEREVQILSYDLYPIEPKMYYYAIYDRVKVFLNEKGFI